jgi:hypothetical protein
VTKKAQQQEQLRLRSRFQRSKAASTNKVEQQGQIKQKTTDEKRSSKISFGLAEGRKRSSRISTKIL